MSWFKGALDKVREKGVAVKEIAKDVAHKTKEVRSRIVGATTTAELGTQLEVKAGGVYSVLHLYETVKAWLNNIQQDEQQRGYRYQDSEQERQLNFTQVLLRSNAIEELLACVVCNPPLRSDLCEAWKKVRELDTQPELSEKEVAAKHLYTLLSKTLIGTSWYEVLTVLLSPHGHDETELPKDEFEEDVKIRDRADSSADWMARCQRGGFRIHELGIIGQLKRDWYDDWLEMERRDLAATVDLKKNELVQRTTSTPMNPFVDPIWNRIRLSGELVDLYESVKDNLDNCTMNRSESKKSILSGLGETVKKVEEAKESAKADELKSIERKGVISENAKEIEIEFDPKLKKIFEERMVVDSKIASLEDQRQRLKEELERVSNQIVDAQLTQRSCMEIEEKVRTEWAIRRAKFQSMLIEESKEERRNKLDQEVNSNLVKVIEKSKTEIDSLFRDSQNELNDVYTQFDNSFVEAVQDHMTVLCDSVQDIYRRTKKLSDEMESVKRTKNSTSMSEMLNSSMNESEKQEFNASVERLNVKLGDVESKLRMEQDEVDRFQKTFNEFFQRFENKLQSNRLLKGEVDKVNIVFGESQKILNKYLVFNTALQPPQVLQEDAIIDN